MWALFVPTCEASWLQTNNCIMAATAISAASAPSFPSVTSITESLSLPQNRSGCWRSSLSYEPACDLVIGLLHCNEYHVSRLATNTLGIAKSQKTMCTKTVFKRSRSPLEMGAHFQESVDLAGFLKIIFLKMGRFQAHVIRFFLEIRKWADFKFQDMV